MVTTTIVQSAPSEPTSSTGSEQPNSTTTATSISRRSNENRRSNKPIMEKRRRARINNCLNELKTLILDAMKKDPARHSKLEKADILEMTVKHLQNLQRQQAAMSAATDPTIVNKFRAGFSECAGEVGRFPGLEPAVKRRLLQHLANCLTTGQTNKNDTSSQQQQQQPQVQVHILPQSDLQQIVSQSQTLSQIQSQSLSQSQFQSQSQSQSQSHTQSLTQNGIIFSNASGVQLVPTRLPNGDIALVLPASNSPISPPSSSSSSPLPLLVPIPARAASVSSCSSPELMDHYGPVSHKPLALVVKKNNEPLDNEDRPWRPW